MKEFDNLNPDSKRTACKCFCLIIALMSLLTIGCYFLIESYIDPQSSEIISLQPTLNAWNASYNFFSSLTITLSTSNFSVTLQNTSSTSPTPIMNFPSYPHMMHSSDLILSKFSNSIKTQDINDSYYQGEHINTVDLELIIDDNNGTIVKNVLNDVVIHTRKHYTANGKVCRNSAKGYWDSSVEICYFHYNTIEVCVLVNDNLTLVEWYKKGCDNKGYIKQEAISWVTDKEFTDFGYSQRFIVRSDKDPEVIAMYNGLNKLSSSSHEYLIIGGTFLGVSGILLLVPILYCCVTRRKRAYKNIREPDII